MMKSCCGRPPSIRQARRPTTARLPVPFAAKWKQKYNEEPPLSVAAQIYDEVMLWAAAVNKAGSATDYSAIASALRDNPYDGITGVVKFKEQQYVTSSDETVPTQL